MAIVKQNYQLVAALFLGITLLLAVTACGDDQPAVIAPVSPDDPATAVLATQTDTKPTATAVPPTITPIPPTPTPSEPLAALVNDEPIYLAAYERELARYEQAQAELDLPTSEDYPDVVLNALIERSLITQAAADQGIQITSEMVSEKLIELRETAGGDENFAAWLEANQWAEGEFREALVAEMLTAQMRDIITADVPYAVEQVHARYLQVDDGALASDLLGQIQGGADFSSLAQQHSLDKMTAPQGGDLNFFGRDFLLVPEVEAAAFDLQPGEVSDVIAVTGADGSQTYYIVQTLEREAQRTLKPDLRYKLLEGTFEAWLTNQWEQAVVERYVNTDD